MGARAPHTSTALALMLVSVRLLIAAVVLFATVRLLTVAIRLLVRPLLLHPVGCRLLRLTIIAAAVVASTPASALGGRRQRKQSYQCGDGELLYAFHVRSLLI